jgi:molybdopterin molybdotransferase
LFGLLGGRPFWGVPGNPVSAMVTFEILVRPALRRMAGFARFLPASILCRLSGDARGPADVVSLLRVRLVDVSTDPPTVSLTGPQGSGILSSMLADGLLELPMGVEVIGDGEHGRVLPLRRWSLPG